MINTNIAKQMLFRAQTDPEWWMTTALGSKPWSMQLEIIDGLINHREVAVKSCHSAGKSWTAARAILWFSCCFPHSIVITTAPTDRQVRNILWREIRVAHKRSILPIGGKLLTQSLEFDDDWWAIGFTAPEYDPDRFQGFHAKYVLVVVDEASGVSEEIFEAIASILSGENAALLVIGNPTDEQSHFGRMFKMPGVKKITISAFDTPNFAMFGITLEDIISGEWEDRIKGPLPYPVLITPQWVRERLDRWGLDSPMFQSRILANFPPQGSDTLIPMAWIEAAQNRDLTPGVNDEVELGVDVARFGSDDSEIYKRIGPVVRHVETISGIDTMALTGRVNNHIKEQNAKAAKVDVIGVGSGVVDRLMELDLDCEIVPVNFGEGSSDREQFLNLRAQVFWGLRQRFEDGDMDIDPRDEELAEQLSSIKYKYNSRGQIQIEPKDDLKKRLGRSPDKADAVAILTHDMAESFSPQNVIVAPRLTSADPPW